MEGIKGLGALVRSLDTLKTSGARRVAKAGVNAGLTVLAQAMRVAINASGASPAMKRAVKVTISKRLKRKEGQPTVGKAGFAVGKRSAAKLAKAAARAGDRSRRGVGISAANVHWAVLGTAERNQATATKGRGAKARQVPTGRARHRTGRMPSQLPAVIASAASAAHAAMLEAARRKMEQVMQREAARARAK